MRILSKILKIFTAILIVSFLILAGLFLVGYFYGRENQVTLSEREVALMQELPEAIETSKRVLGGEFADEEAYVTLLVRVALIEGDEFWVSGVNFGAGQGEKALPLKLSSDVVVAEVSGFDEMFNTSRVGGEESFASSFVGPEQKDIPFSNLKTGDIIGVYQERRSQEVVKIIRLPREVVEKLPFNL